MNAGYDRVWQPASADTYADIAPCGRCGKDVVLDHDPPCPHGYCVCPECEKAEVCHACALVELGDLYTTIDDLQATVRRVESLRNAWREIGYYGSPGDVRKQYDGLARTLTKALEGEVGSE